ncbi:hypothetical protein B0H12DRAFT_119014 [Mycena haematopus]|nr:hypothetical protein B0H12DRAFT_119014 [Mycena haematopus]
MDSTNLVGYLLSPYVAEARWVRMNCSSGCTTYRLLFKSASGSKCSNLKVSQIAPMYNKILMLAIARFSVRTSQGAAKPVLASGIGYHAHAPVSADFGHCQRQCAAVTRGDLMDSVTC